MTEPREIDTVLSVYGVDNKVVLQMQVPGPDGKIGDLIFPLAPEEADAIADSLKTAAQMVRAATGHAPTPPLN